MSKSKGNVVSPDELIARFGADTVRLYTLFMGPPDKDAEWSDQGVEGAYRFLGRVWRFVTQVKSWKVEGRVTAKELMQSLHSTIKKVSADLEGDFRFNTAVSAIMELVNAVYQFAGHTDADRALLERVAENVVLLLAPFVPHLTEELWQRLGHSKSLATERWPVHDPKMLERSEMLMVVQVNGKVRARITVPSAVSDEALKQTVLAHEQVKRFLNGQTVKQFIVVPKRLVNIVV